MPNTKLSQRVSRAAANAAADAAVDAAGSERILTRPHNHHICYVTQARAAARGRGSAKPQAWKKQEGDQPPLTRMN